MKGVTAYSELASPSDETAHDPDHAPEHALVPTEAQCDNNPCAVEPADIDPDHLILATSRASPRKRAGPSHALLKALIAVVTTQYIIVTVLVALAAIIVANQAGTIINAKLELIIAALKRL